MNDYMADTFEDNAAEYAFIREQEARENGQDAIALWHESAEVKPVQYTTLAPR